MKGGFTLIELLVYIAIMSFIVVVAGRAFSDSTGMRMRTQSMTKATEEANRIAELIKEDMSQMGAKVLGTKSNTPTDLSDHFFNIDLAENVYMNASLAVNDSSSFNLFHKVADKYDSIEFKKISYKENGEYIGIRLITWYARNDTLYRSCRTIEAPTNSNTTTDPELAACPAAAEAAVIAMAENVQTFIFNPGKPLDDTSPFGGAATQNKPAPTFGLISQSTSGEFHAVRIAQPAQSNTAILGGDDLDGDGRYYFVRNQSESGTKQHQVYVAEPNTGGTISACKQFTFKKGETYAVKFKTPINLIEGNIPDSMMALFQPSVDHMAVGFRNPNGGPVTGLPADFTFYPPQKTINDDGSTLVLNINQYFEFSVPNDGVSNALSNACVVFTFAFYSGSDAYGPHKGRLRIKDFELQHKKDGAYEFVRDGVYATSDNQEKRNVKAFELILAVNKRNEIGSTRRCWKDEGGTEVCGGYVIPVPNNGIVPQ